MMTRARAIAVDRLTMARALVLRVIADHQEVLRELAPLLLTLALAPWFRLAFGNYRDGAVFRDVSMFNYAAFCVRKGERIYDTVATPDGPLIYWIEGIFQRFSGTDDKLQRQLDLDFQTVVGAVLGLLLVPRAPVWKWLRRFVWAIVGATLWLAWVVQSDFASTLQRETYYVTLGSLGIALVYASADVSRPRVARAMQIMGGFLAGLQIFGKHSGVLYAGAAILVAIVLPRERTSRRMNIACAAGGVLLAGAFVFGWLALFGSVRGFIFWYVHYDFEAYRFIRINNASEIMSGYRIDFYAYALGVLMVGVIGVVTRALPARSLGIAVVPMLSSYANILQLHGWHYQLVPVIASTYLFYLYVFGQSLAPAGRFTRMHQIAAVGVTALLVPLVAKQTMGSPWLHPKEKQLVAGDIVNPHDAGVWLAMHTRSTDRVLYYGGDPVAPFVAQRLPATPYIVRWLVDLTRQVPEPPDLDISHKPTLEQSAHIYVMQAKLENDACKRVLDNPPPAMIFEGTPGYTTDALTDYQNFCRPLADLMKQQYHPGAQFGDTRIFLRNDRD